MRVKIINYEDLSESRELLNAREPNFFAVFIYLLFCLLIAVMLWLWFGEIDIVVKASGIVRTVSNVSIIRNINEGTVVYLNYREGQVVEAGEVLYALSNRFHQIEYENCLLQKKKISAEIGMLSKLEESMLKQVNLFQLDKTPLENEYFSRYEAFQKKYEQLISNREKAFLEVTAGRKLGADLISRNELDRLEREYEYAALELDKYFNETIFAIKSELKTQKDQLLQINSKLRELEEEFRRSQVRAPISGVVQVIEKFNQGDFMPAGMAVIKIVPEKEDTKLKMELSIANKDIGLIKTGQQVKYRFLALPYKEYGTLTGEIKVVAGDISVTQDPLMPYRVEGTIEQTKLYDKEGNPAQIKVGMLCDARIIVKRKKILYIVLEKLDFR